MELPVPVADEIVKVIKSDPEPHPYQMQSRG
jgi:hypothetical protein